MTDDETKCTRPAEYSQEIAMEIHDRLVDGQSLRTICADPAMPDRATVSEWLVQRPRFRDICRMARESCAYLLMDDALEIVDDREGDYVEKVQANGKVARVFDPYNLAFCRLRLEVRHWVADRLAPGGIRFNLNPDIKE